MKRFLQKLGPIPFSGVLLALILALRFLAALVTARLNLPEVASAIIGNGALAAIALLLLSYLHVWRPAGFRPPAHPRALWLFALPCLPVIVPLAARHIGYPGLVPLLLALAASALIGFVEEAFFRGLMAQALAIRGPWLAAILSSIFFAIASLLGGGFPPTPAATLLAIAYALALGLMYCALALRAQTLLPLIAIHSLTVLLGVLSPHAAGAGVGPLPAFAITAGEAVLFMLYGILLLLGWNPLARVQWSALLPRRGQRAAGAPPLASSAHVVMIVPPIEGEREALAMENWLQACSSEEPFTLELCGNRRVQCILLRAGSPESLEALCKQIQAQYPQAKLYKVAGDKKDGDPLLLSPGEYGLIGELALRDATWMPIKTFWGREMTDSGTDPLPGIFAAMEPLEEGVRMICQLALVRAPDGWADRYTRKTVEHPLTEERDKAMAASRGVPAGDATGDGLKILLGLLLLAALARGYLWYRQGELLPLVLMGAGCLAAFIAFLWWWMHRSTPIYDMKLIATKLLRVGFYARVRVIVIARPPEPTQAERAARAAMTPKQLAAALKKERDQREAALSVHIDRMEMAYRQFNLASANGFVLKRVSWISAEGPEAHTLFLPRHAFPYHGHLSQMLHGGPSPDILNAREASGMVHLPQAEADIPLLKRLPTKHILASAEIAQRLQHALDAIPPVLLGHSQQRGHSVPVYLPETALFSQKVAVAKSRYGKSTLMQLLAQGAMVPLRGGGGLQPGICIVDPHRDLFEDILHLVPSERAGDVILIDLSDTERPVGINPLDAGLGFTPDQALANIMNSFSKAWFDFWGPRMAFYLSNVLRTLYVLNMKRCAAGKRDQQYTLLDVNPMLQYPDYARAVISELDPSDAQEAELLAWWRDTYFKLNPQSTFKNEVISPILSKMGMFSEKRVLRRIVGQPVSRVDIASVVNRGAICLISLSSKELEDDAVAILGATLVNLLHRSIQSQATLPRHQRRRVFIAIDEFQAVPGADYEKLLAEDGKYGGWLMLATQNLKRLNRIRDGLLDIVLANCEQLFAFSVSASDAEVMESELHKRVTPEHIMSQPRLSCYARLVLPDLPLQIASLTLAQPASWQRTPQAVRQAEDIRDASRAGYLTAQQVEDHLSQHVQSYLDLDIYTRNLRREVASAARARAIREDEKRKDEQLQRDRLAAQNTVPVDPQQGNGSNGATTHSAPTAPVTPTSNGNGAAATAGGRRNNHSRSKRGGGHGDRNSGGLPPPTPPAHGKGGN